MKMTPNVKRNIVILVGLLMVSVNTFAKDPKELQNESWVNVSGTVASANDNGFRLDYGESMIYVEMDDWDWFEEGKTLIPGHHVQVLGRIDDDAFEARSIEAYKVYVKGLNSLFFEPEHFRILTASPEDEELNPEIYSKALFGDLSDGAFVSITGEVLEVKGRHFIVDTGANKVRVDTYSMSYNPMDDKGYQKVEEGDMLHVTGNLDLDLFEKKEIIAHTITTWVADSN
jgi:uncharacterized protein YdeI (BOF family)